MPQVKGSVPQDCPKFRCDAKIRPLYTSTEFNLGDRVLTEVEKNSFIALSGKGGHSGLISSKLCALTWRG